MIRVKFSFNKVRESIKTDLYWRLPQIWMDPVWLPKKKCYFNSFCYHLLNFLSFGDSVWVHIWVYSPVTWVSDQWFSSLCNESFFYIIFVDCILVSILISDFSSFFLFFSFLFIYLFIFEDALVVSLVCLFTTNNTVN